MRSPSSIGGDAGGATPSADESPSAAASVGTTAASEPTVSRATNHTPPGYSSRWLAANSDASRVLPQPPAPTSVARRCSASARATPAMSSARPTNVVNARRRLVGAAARAVGVAAIVGASTATIGDLGSLERRVLGEDRGLQPAQVGAGFEPELVGQEVPGVGVGAQGFGLPARAVQGEHQLAAEALAEGSAGDRGVELGDEIGVAAHRQQGVETILGDRLSAAPPTDSPRRPPSARRRTPPAPRLATARAPVEAVDGGGPPGQR